MKDLKIVVRDIRKEISDNLMKSYETEFFELKMREIKQEKEEIKMDPDNENLFVCEKMPKMPKAEIKEETLLDPPYECKKCKLVYIARHHFIKHKCASTFNCLHCTKKFLRNDHLRKHLKSAHNIQMYAADGVSCDICGNFFYSKDRLQLHLKVCSVKKYKREAKFSCDHCGKKCFIKSKLEKHIVKHAIYDVECGVCHLKVRPVSLYYHMIRNHPRNEEKFECEKCPEMFKSYRLLYEHLKKIHNRIFECYDCHKKFSSQGALNFHRKFHENPEQFKCKICGHQLTSQKSLKDHLRLHDKNRIKHLKCNQCEYKADNQRYLNKHLKRHDKNREKRYKCSHCDYKAFSFGNLKRHMNSHKNLEQKLKSNESAQKCSLCPAVLLGNDSFRRHLALKHPNCGFFMFQCDLCEKVSLSKWGLQQHLVKKHLRA